MALYDPISKKIVVRIAYDGPAEAGKTTNLEQLCAMFTTQRRSEMTTPESRDGRTMYFDWLQLDGGLVSGHALRSHLVTVPGQHALRERRRYLLDAADIVVFVCESTVAGLLEARPMFELLCDQLSSGGDALPRIIVQANKQDLEHAVDIANVREHLGISGDVQVMLASAVGGTGVRESVTLAIRTAATLAGEQLRERGVDALEGIPPTSADLYAALRAAEEFTSATTLGESANPAVVTSAGAADDPDLPSPFVPLDFIWPQLLGREILHRMAHNKGELDSQPSMEAGAGRLVVNLPRWTLSTTRALRFDDEKTARVALRRSAERMSCLGHYLHHRTVLCLQPAGDGTLWLWTVLPTVKTLRDCLSDAAAAGDDVDVRRLLNTYIGAVVDAVLMTIADGVLVEMRARSFGCEDDRLVYVGDRIERFESALRLGYALLQVADCIELYAAAGHSLLSELASAVGAAVADDAVAAGRLRESLEYASPRTGPGKRLQQLLLGRLQPNASARTYLDQESQ